MRRDEFMKQLVVLFDKSKAKGGIITDLHKIEEAKEGLVWFVDAHMCYREALKFQNI